jgi:hypothetical protein
MKRRKKKRKRRKKKLMSRRNEYFNLKLTDYYNIIVRHDTN